MKRSHSLGALVGIALALISAIAGTNLFTLSNLRESSLRTAEGNLNRYSMMLAENANRSFKSLDLILSSIGDHLLCEGADDAESYRRLGSDQKINTLLQEKFAGLPEVDAVTLIDVNGKLINFSRYWPGSAFAEERGRDVRLPPALGPRHAAREKRYADDRERVSRTARWDRCGIRASARAGCTRGATLSCDDIRINRPGSIFVVLWLIA